MKKEMLTAIVLAGGKSSRMGTDKGFVLYKGKSFMQRIIETAQPLVDEIIIVSSNKDYDCFNLKRVDDVFENQGPLAGLYSGLFHTKTENNIVLSCDVPLINKTLLEMLVNNISVKEDVVQLSSNGKVNPLIAIYKKRCLPVCLSTLQLGERRMRAFVKLLEFKTVVVNESLEKYALNINTQDELKNIEE